MASTWSVKISPHWPKDLLLVIMMSDWLPVRAFVVTATDQLAEELRGVDICDPLAGETQHARGSDTAT